jgi:cell division protease FtsH
LGLTHYLPLDEKHNYSRSYLNQTLTHFLGGRAAEKLIFHEQSTGAGNDLERATEIARKMVCEWGMSDRVGPVVFGKKNEEIFLGRDFGHAKEYSERTAQDIDMELRRIITDAEKRAERLIADNLAKLKVLAEALLEREILDGEEIDTLLKGRQLPPMVPKNAEAPAPQLPRREPRRRRPPLDKPASPQVEAARARREFARSFGVASSRDPENRRPVKFGRPVRPAPKPPESGEGAATEPPAPPQTPTETSPEFKAGFVPKGRAPRHRPPRRGWSSRRLDQPAGHEPGASSEPEPKLEVSESLPRPMLPEIKPEPAPRREYSPPPPPAERRPEPPSSPSLQREYPPPPPPVEQRPEPPSSPSGYQPPPPSDYHGGEGGD